MVVGRRAERLAIERFATGMGDGARALVIEGGAGIGKTTLWQEGVERLRATGLVVLEARPAESEATLPFAALADVLEPIPAEFLAALPMPQRRALDSALQRAPVDEPSSRLALARATLALMRAQAAARPVAVAVDDVQWLDPPSAQVLAFVLRREAPHRLLVSQRTDGSEPPPLGLGRGPAPRVQQLRVGPLAAAELGRLVDVVLGVHLSGPTLLDLHRTSGGNPFYALEIVRSAPNAEGAIDDTGLPIPDSLGALLRGRVESLSDAARDVALLCSGTSQPTTGAIVQAGGSIEGIAEARGARVLRLEGERLRLDHPLLASVVYQSAMPAERRDAHRRLADALGGDARALHLALATEAPDEAVAGELAAAADRAVRLHARATAAELGEHALRLTPADSPSLGRRIVAAADYWLAAGETVRSRELLERAVSGARPGPERAAILLPLGIVCYRAENLPAASQILDQAATEAGEDLALRVEIGQARAFLATGLGDVAGGIERAREALALAERLGDPGLLSLALARVAAAEFYAGTGLDRDRFERAIALEAQIDRTLTEWLPSANYAWAAGFADDAATARTIFERFHRPLIERDGELALPLLLFQSQFELRAGNWSLAEQITAEALELSLLDAPATARAFALGSRALVDAHLGRLEDARRRAEDGLAFADAAGAVPPVHLLRWALGFLELSLGDPGAAHANLGPLGEMCRAIGVAEPGFVRFMPDEIEALVSLDRLDEARSALEQLEDSARAAARVSMIAAGCRCRALLSATEGDATRAGQAIAEAHEHHSRLAQPFELARTRLVQGTIERRANHRAAAREALVAALEVFDSLGAPLWAEKAATELARVPGRRRSDATALTLTERRVAELVTEGLSNKQVAAALFITVRTVEANLTTIYRKLGVRSRTELARRLGEETEPENRPGSDIETKSQR